MKLSVVIPSYNSVDLLRSNLPKIYGVLDKASIEGKELVIIDDKSKDESYEFLQDFKKDFSKKELPIVVSQTIKNLGFSSAVNKGVGLATGDIVILLNTDVTPRDDFVNPLLVHFADPSVFAVGCLDESIEGGSIVPRGRGVGRWEKGFLIHSAGSLEKDNTLWVSGGSGAFRKSIWDKLGGLEELYNPFYWEDIDISYRALKSGYKVFFEKKSVVSHEHEKGSIKRQFTSSKIKNISYRNQISFVWLNITDARFFLSHLLWLPYHVLSTLIRLDYSFSLGLISALFRLPKIILKRTYKKKIFKISDKEVLLPFSADFAK